MPPIGVANSGRIFSRRLRLVALVASLLATCLGCSIAGVDQVGQRTLRVLETASIRLDDVSGLGWRLDPRKKSLQLVAVSDDEFAVMVANWVPHLPSLVFERHDLSAALRALALGNKSNWEAVAADATGALFILQEQPGGVVVLSPDLNRVVHVVEFLVEPSVPFSEEWEEHPNSRGEGLVLLRNGHLLVAKEKKPSLLIEFGLPGDQPRGYRKGDALGKDDTFSLPRGTRSRFVPLAYWRLSARHAARLEDISEVAVGPDGNIYLLSEKSRCIVLVGNSVPVGRVYFPVLAVWQLLEEHHATPEGLVMTGKLAPIIASDQRDSEANLLKMSPLP